MKLLRTYLARRRLAKSIHPDPDAKARRAAQLSRPEIQAQRNRRRLILATRDQEREVFAARLETVERGIQNG